MATAPLSCFRTSPVSPVLCSASSSSSSRSNHPTKHDPTRQKGASSWWTPLFGWSSDPDYIVPGSSSGNPTKGEPGRSETVDDRTTRSKFGVGCFTEKKAKELRKKTMETSNFHDIMYHSAIASRLASDVSDSGRQGI